MFCLRDTVLQNCTVKLHVREVGTYTRMSNKFLEFLYGTSQDASLQEDDALELYLHRLTEALESTEKIQVRRKPLEKAVRALGVATGEFEVEEGIVLALVFNDSEEYLKAAAILGDVNLINELAELGWVAVIDGDQASQTEEPVYRINFIPIDEAELSTELPKVDTNKLVAKAADDMNEPGTQDITNTKDRRHDLPKGVGKDASQFESLEAETPPTQESVKQEASALVDRMLNEDDNK